MPVTMVDRNKAVVCCLQAILAVMLSEKKKIERNMWSKKCYLKRNTYHAMEGWVPWDDAIVVSAGKLRKLSEMYSSLCERRLQRTVLRPALLPVQTTQFTMFFRRVWRHTVKLLSLTESVYGAIQQIAMCSKGTPKIGRFHPFYRPRRILGRVEV
jgi:hypothetical protein